MMATHRALLETAIAELNLTLDEGKIEQLLAYIGLLSHWNKAYNLTAIEGEENLIKRHLVDSLSILPTVDKLNVKSIADIGTGAGLPGLVIAITRPELSVNLVESIGKKCRFLRHVCQTLHLASTCVIQTRVENYQVDKPFDAVICRAFSALDNFVKITAHLGDEKTYWLAMKADQLQEEIKALPQDFVIKDNLLLHVPFESAARRLLCLQRLNSV